MSESNAVILGCAGKTLSAEEVAFYRGERPWGFILFARNIGTRRAAASVAVITVPSWRRRARATTARVGSSEIEASRAFEFRSSRRSPSRSFIATRFLSWP